MRERRRHRCARLCWPLLVRRARRNGGRRRCRRSRQRRRRCKRRKRRRKRRSMRVSVSGVGGNAVELRGGLRALRLGRHEREHHARHDRLRATGDDGRELALLGRHDRRAVDRLRQRRRQRRQDLRLTRDRVRRRVQRQTVGLRRRCGHARSAARRRTSCRRHRRRRCCRRRRHRCRQRRRRCRCRCTDRANRWRRVEALRSKRVVAARRQTVVVGVVNVAAPDGTTPRANSATTHERPVSATEARRGARRRTHLDASFCGGATSAIIFSTRFVNNCAPGISANCGLRLRPRNIFSKSERLCVVRFAPLMIDRASQTVSSANEHALQVVGKNLKITIDLPKKKVARRSAQARLNVLSRM